MASAMDIKFSAQHRAGRPDCEICGTRMRIRLTGPEILPGGKQTAVYVCECGHEQSYVEDLNLAGPIADQSASSEAERSVTPAGDA